MKNLEKRIIIKGYEEITSKEFYNLKQNNGLRLFNYKENCKQTFYKKSENFK